MIAFLMAESFVETPTITARLDRLPPSRFLRSLVVRISIGGFFELYDLFMTGYIAVGLIQAGIFKAASSNPMHVNAYAGFVASGFAGMFVGTLVFSWFSDRYGRRAIFTFSLILYSFATLLMALMRSPVAIDLWRFICGLGIGVQLVTISSYLAEVTPKAARGRYVALSQFISYCAVPTVAAVSLLAIPRTILALAGWRWVAILGAGGAICAWPLWVRLPESPRWLSAHGRDAEAEAITGEMERHVITETGGPLTQPDRPTQATRQPRGAWQEIWHPDYLRRTLMLILFNIFQAIGFYGFAAWVPVLLVSEGIEVTKSLTYVLLIALLNPFGALLAMRYADRFQRKWQIVALALISAVCGLLWARQRSVSGIILFGAVITLANSWFSCALHTYQTELYPTRIRAQAVGFVYSWSRFSSIFVGFLIARALHAYGTTGAFAIVAAAMFLAALVVGLLGPNSSRIALEEISH
jgi:MFS transporter, putative metabolite:H+ symporter